MNKNLFIIFLIFGLLACKNPEKKLTAVMKHEMIGVQKEFFEKDFGPAKYIYGSKHNYIIDGCEVNVEYGVDKSINSIELYNISEICSFNTNSIGLYGEAYLLTYQDLISNAMSWDADISCYALCGNVIEPTYGITVRTPRVSQNIEYEAFSDWTIASDARDNVKAYFHQKYPDFEMIGGGDLGPIDRMEYNEIWILKFKNIKISSLKFGYNIINQN
jgi:hypothetical protein